MGRRVPGPVRLPGMAPPVLVCPVARGRALMPVLWLRARLRGMGVMPLPLVPLVLAVLAVLVLLKLRALRVLRALLALPGWLALARSPVPLLVPRLVPEYPVGLLRQVPHPPVPPPARAPQ